MKFNIADVPVNVVDGVLKYPKVALLAAGVIVGVAGTAFYVSEWAVFGWAVVLLAASTVAAYFAGKPRK